MLISSHNSDPAQLSGSPPTPWLRVQVLGQGSYAIVYLAVYAKSNRNGVYPQIAVKTALIEEASSLMKENRIYKAMRYCPEIVYCYFAQKTIERGLGFYNLALEYAPAGTLKDLIKKTDGHGMPENDVRAYARMILRGLRYMHAKGYVHCDLKPDNILAFPPEDRNNLSTVAHQLKLVDFGLAKEPGEEIPREKWIGRFRGSPYYMAPESVGLGIIWPGLDIWSLGCIVMLMITGCRSPWPGFEDLSSKQFKYLLVRSNMRPIIPPLMSDTGKDFLRRCLERDPRKRWSAQMLLLHPYVNELISNAPRIAPARTPTSPSPDLN